MKSAFILGAPLLLIVLLVNGAVPGLMAPTTAQLFWSTGFSQSFANGGLSIFAQNFGLPEPAAMAFGLAGAFPVAVLIKIGIHPIEAYTTVFALWLTVAFVGAYWLAKQLGGSSFVSLCCAAIWGTMPVIGQHQAFGMVALGMALLPFYVAVSYRLMRGEKAGTRIATLFIAACVVAVFMDGYTYMMFAVATGFIALATLIERWGDCRKDTFIRLAVVAAGFAASYLLYIAYLGKSGFEAAELDFFRGWAASIEFLFVATKGLLLIPDLIGISDKRLPDEYFGDPSTYISTFALPIAAVAAICLLARAGKLSDRVIFALIALFGFYMCLGPSVKFLTYRSEGMSQLMPADLSRGGTGSAWFSEHLPGFKNMRASYRWVALGIFGSWAILALAATQRDLRKVIVPCMIAAAIFNIPTIASLTQPTKFRQMAYAIDRDVEQMRPFFKPGEKVAMLPYRNDFLANYIAARLNIETYNIGGDKNLVEASEHWPVTMQRFSQGIIDDQYPRNVAAILESADADAVMLPYFDLLEAAHKWPYPKDYEGQMRAIAAAVDADPRIVATYAEQFAVLRLSYGLKGLGDTAREPLKIDRSEVLVSSSTTDQNTFAGVGWYPLEPTGIWSRGSSELIINVKDASDHLSGIQLTFTPYTPQPDDKMTVTVLDHGNLVVEKEFTGQTPNASLLVALSPEMIDEKGNIRLHIEASPLHSPADNGSADARRLGIMLHSVSPKFSDGNNYAVLE